MLAAAQVERQAADGRPRPAVLPRVRLRGRGGAVGALRRAPGRALLRGSSPSPTGRAGSATPTAAAARRSTCTSTTPTSSASSAACPGPSSRRGVVERRGGRPPDDPVPLRRPGGPAVSAVSGALSQAGRPFAHGFEIYLERATLSSASRPGELRPPLTVILARRHGRAAGAGVGRPGRRLRRGAGGGRPGRSRRAGSRRALGRPGAAGAGRLPGRGRERQDGQASVGAGMIMHAGRQRRCSRSVATDGSPIATEG